MWVYIPTCWLSKQEGVYILMIRKIIESIDEQSNLPTKEEPLILTSHPDLTDWEKEVLLHQVNMSGDEMEFDFIEMPTGQYRWQIWARGDISPYDFYDMYRGIRNSNRPGAAEERGLVQDDDWTPGGDDDEGEEWKN